MAANGKKRVTFTVAAPEAREVFLCGTFNNWDLAKTPMKPDGNGGFKALVMLEPGQYEYRLRIDGDWTNDPQAEGFVPNSFGTENCVRLVKAA